MRHSLTNTGWAVLALIMAGFILVWRVIRAPFDFASKLWRMS